MPNIVLGLTASGPSESLLNTNLGATPHTYWITNYRDRALTAAFKQAFHEIPMHESLRSFEMGDVKYLNVMFLLQWSKEEELDWGSLHARTAKMKNVEDTVNLTPT